MDELVKAKCGKMVKRERLAQHERLCTACGGKNPAALRQAAIQEDRAADVEEKSGGPGDTPAADLGGGKRSDETSPPVKSEPSPEDSLVDKVADKVLGVLSPALKERFDEIAAAIGSNKMPSTEELQGMIKAQVNETISALLESKEAAPAGAAPGNGNGGGELTQLIQAVQGFMPKQAAGGGMSAQAMFDFMQKQWEAMNAAQRSGIDLVNTVMNAALKANRDVGAADVTKSVVDNFKSPTPPPTVK